MIFYNFRAKGVGPDAKGLTPGFQNLTIQDRD